MPVLPRRDEFGRLACCCYINAAKLVAGVGIAPTSADFQPAAHLSEPSKRLEFGPSAWCRATVSRLSGGCSAVELRRDEIGGAPENRTLDAFTGRSGFRDRFLVCAGRAPLKSGSLTSTCTMTIGVTGRQATLPHEGF